MQKEQKYAYIFIVENGREDKGAIINKGVSSTSLTYFSSSAGSKPDPHPIRS